MRRISIFLFSMSLVVTACTGSAGETTTSASPTTTAVSETTTTAAETTTSQAGATTTTTSQSAGGIDECLVGTWILDSEAFVENFSSIFEDAGMPDAEVTPLDGTFTVEFGADGSMSGVRDSWGFSFTIEQGTFTTEIEGFELGTWSGDGSTLTVNIESSDLTVNATVESGGQEIELPQGQTPIEAPPGIASNSEYACSGDVLTLTNAGVESVLNRA